VRVLILSCNTGEGHNSCAKAIKEVFDAKGETCVIEDSLRFISEKTSRFLSWGHVFVYRNIPWLFNFGYGFTEKHPSYFKENSRLYHFFAKGSDELYKFIVRGTYDTVICVHPFASLMMTEMQKRYHLPVKTAFVATDYTCSPSVQESNLNYYFIPNEALVSEFECVNIPREKIVSCGIPIRQMFYKSTAKDEAKCKFGIATDHKHMVMMCGSMGCGPIEKLAGILTAKLKEGFDLTVVCGTNEKLKAQLERKYGNRKNLHILGYVKDMSALLDSADLYLTKAGGISVTEAATKNVPMIFIHAVAGCEDYNSAFYTQLGCAVKSNDVNELTKLCISLVQDENRYNSLANAIATCRLQNASECIYNTLKEA
jgi:processive 1,2-diacylglycerol beta-glucosyltransferase